MQDVDLWSPGYKMSQLHYFIRWDVDVINVFMRNVLVTFDFSPPNSKSSCAKCEDRCCWGLAFTRKSHPELRATFDLQNLISAPLSGSGRLGLKFEVIPSGGRFKAYFFCYVLGNISSIFNRRALTSASELPGTTTQIPHRHRETSVQSASIWTQIRECW